MSILANITNILFDLDGTLTDPRKGITRCIQYALKRSGMAVPPSEQLIWCIGPPLKNAFSNLMDTRDDIILERAVRYYRERFAEKGIFENSLYTGVVTSLGKLRSVGYRLYLSTSKPKVFATQILDHFNLTPFFHTVYGSELEGRWSEKGELIAYIIDQENLHREATLMVGDRIHDIDGGKENGVMTAAVSYGFGTRDEIVASGPDIVFESIEELTTKMLSVRLEQTNHHL